MKQDYIETESEVACIYRLIAFIQQRPSEHITDKNMSTGNITQIYNDLDHIRSKDITYDEMISQANNKFKLDFTQYINRPGAILDAFQQYFNITAKGIEEQYDEKKLDLLHDMFKIISTQIVEEFKKNSALSGCINTLYRDEVLNILLGLKLGSQDFALASDDKSILCRLKIYHYLPKVMDIYEKVGRPYGLSAKAVVQYMKEKKDRNKRRHFSSRFAQFRDLCEKNKLPIKFKEFLKQEKLCRKTSDIESDSLQLLFDKNCIRRNDVNTAL